MTTTTGNTSSSISNNFAITISSTLRTEPEALLTASERSGSSDTVSSRIAHILSISSKAETLTARITSLVSIPSLHARTVALLACDDTQRILYEEFGVLSMNTIFARPDSSEHRFMCSILRLDMALKKSVAAAQHNVKEMVLPLALELARDPFISATLNNHQELKRVAQMLSEHIQDRDVLAKRAVVLYMTAIVSSPRIHAVVRAEKAYESVKQKIAYAQVLFKNHKRMTMFIATFAILLVTLVIWIAIYLRSRYQHPVTILPIIHSHTMGHF